VSRPLVPTRPAFGRLLRRLRHQRHLSQHLLSLAAGYDGSYVHRLERGERTPSLATVVALAEVLALSYDDTCRLHIAAGYLPPGEWEWQDGQITQRKECA
jgi:transcriptional regulator with XRE-family HTH domain